MQDLGTGAQMNTDAPSITVEIGKLMTELDDYLSVDATLMSDEELQDFIINIMYKLYKLTYNALDYANKKLDIVSLEALQYVMDVRKKRVTYSEQTLLGMDKRALVLYSIVSKIDMIDPAATQVLLLAVRQSSR